MAEVESFTLDHTAVKAPYVRLINVEAGPKGDQISNFDVRLLQPNAGEIPTSGLHTIEHLLASLLRDRIQTGSSGEFQKQIELQKLDAMLAVCETAESRRVMLLRHFGEHSEPCGHCDNCLHPPVRFDGTLLVQKLLSCIYRVGQCFAAGYVINVLRGKADDWIRDNRHQELSTFGIGADLTDKDWRAVVRQSIGLGLLQVDSQHHHRLLLTEAARDVLKNRRTVMLRPLKRDKAAGQKPKEEWLRTEREERIWQALRPSDEAAAQNLVQQAWQQGSLKTLTLEIIQGHALRKTLLPENTHLVQFLPRSKS